MSKKKINWIKPFTRQIHPFDWEAGIQAYAENFGGKFEVGYKNQMYLPEDGKHGFYYGTEDCQVFKNILLQKIKSDLNYLNKEAELCRRSCEEVVEAAKTLRLALAGKSDKELAQLDKAYFKKFKLYCFYLEMIPAIEGYLEKKVREILGKVLEGESKKKFDEYFTIISTKIKRVAAEEEEINRLKLAKALRNGKNGDEMVNRHIKKYAWLPFYGLEMEPLNKEDILERIEEVGDPKQQLARRLKEIVEQETRFKEVKNEFVKNGQKELVRWIEILQDYLYLRIYRTDAYRRMLLNLKPFVETLAGKTGWGYHDVIYLRPGEVVYYLENRKLPSLGEIKTREKHWAVVVRDGKLEFTAERKRIEKIRNEELGVEKRKKEKRVALEEREKEILRGQIAQLGEARGRVKVIKSAEEIEKLEEGDILVTSMTTPDMTVALHKAAAIITDEGGITCHAAIVSRELKVPCIIATHRATKVLKDGDLIRVNFIPGVVNKIECLVTVDGYEAMFKVVAEECDKAGREILIISVGERIPDYLEEIYKKKSRQGVEIRFIATKCDKENIDILKHFKKDLGMKVRYYGWLDYTTSVIDRRLASFCVRNPFYPEERRLTLIESRDLAESQAEHFNKVWKKAKPIKV